MRKFLHIVIFALLLCPMMLAGCGSVRHEDYMRLHIRANSNSEADQAVKYLVRDHVVEYLTPYIASVSSRQELIDMLEDKLGDIESVADKVLAEGGFTYQSHASINYEYFPTRVYEDLVLEADYYDALILGLGTATGDNWWCVVYPPLCFVGGADVTGTGFRYKSKIVEWIKSIM